MRYRSVVLALVVVWCSGAVRASGPPPSAQGGPEARTAPISIRNGVVLLPADETLTPFGRPFNLRGKTVTFTPAGDGVYRAETTVLQFDDARGTRQTVNTTSRSATYTITAFAFPFFGSEVRTLYLSQLSAIYLDPPPAPHPFSFAQYGDAEIVVHTSGRRVIAPLLTTTRSQGSAFRPSEVWVREAADRVVVTWWQEARGLAIQAVLFADGTIRFSYRGISNTRGGVAIITSGNESWRTPQVLASATDPVDDVPAMFDIVETSLRRLGETSVLELVIKVRGTIDRAQLADRPIHYQIEFGAPPWTSGSVTSAVTSDSLSIGNDWQPGGPPPALLVDGDTIRILVNQQQAIAAGTLDGQVEVSLFNAGVSDNVTFAARVDSAPQPLRTDFAALAAPVTLAGPITDAFTIPRFNDDVAWEQVRTALELDPATIDAVAVYASFYTSVVLQSGAYAVPGNPGVDGIFLAPTLPSTRPRTPNLLNLGTIGHSHNAIDDFAAQVAMHEIGHRWLFGIQALDDDGEVVHLAESADGHPLRGLDTRAAFPVRNSFDCSVMGGYTYVDNGDGTFSGAGAQEDDCGYGYSWLELYAMGLASANEVAPFFYLTNADPPITLETLFAGPFRATRHDLTIDQVINRLGPRKPAWPNTQRVFRILFVLLHDPAQPLAASDLAAVNHYMRLIKERFAIATGYRGSIDSIYPAGKRRAVGR